MCDCWLQPSEQQHCAWINRTLEIHRKCVNVHWLWGSHELRFLRWSRGVVFSPFRHRLRRSDILLSSTNSSPTIGLVENETKNFCVSDSTMHLKTPLKSPADGWGTEADFRNPFLLRSPESQYYNANVPRHLQWRTWRPAHVVYLVLHSVQWHGETKINIISISNWATKFVWAQTRNILCLFYTNGTHT